MTQPTLSRRIKSLEQALGASLLERSTRRIALTRVGHEVDPMLRQLVRDFEDCVFGIGSFGAKHSGHLAITSVPTAAAAILAFSPLLDDTFILACRKDHPLARRPQVAWKDLAGQPLIVSQRSGNRAIIDHALAKSGLNLDWSIEVGHLATSFGLVEAGVGISVVPRLSLPLEPHPVIKVVPLCDPVVRRTVGIVERRSG